MGRNKDLAPLPALLECNILSGGLRPRLLSFRPSGARPTHLPGVGRHIMRPRFATETNLLQLNA
jgi:hypothetical protein